MKNRRIYSLSSFRYRTRRGGLVSWSGRSCELGSVYYTIILFETDFSLNKNEY